MKSKARVYLYVIFATLALAAGSRGYASWVSHPTQPTSTAMGWTWDDRPTNVATSQFGW